MILFPHEIAGWLTEVEGRGLARLAAGKRALEIGSYCGRSTVCMAQTAERVVSVDPHDGRGTPEPRDTYAAFIDNLKAYGVSQKVTAIRGTLDSHEITGKFGLVFIDGSHDRQSVLRDIGHAREVLESGGILAFHDYRTEGIDQDLGVAAAVNEMLDSGSELVERIGSIAVVRLRESLGASPVIALAMPRRDENVVYGSMLGAMNCVSRPTRVISLELSSSSLLNHNFNTHWAEALNCRETLGATHFAMIHPDIVPEPGWLTTLVDEQIHLDADVVSAVVAIKDARGLSSTAVYQGDPWERRRLTLHEVAELPETFSADDVGGKLMLNTGLWVCDLRREWCDDAVFSSKERIGRRNGRRVAEVIPEDWLLSHWLNQLGAKIYATRKIRIRHHGSCDFGNWPDAVDGWKTDESFQPMEAAV